MNKTLALKTLGVSAGSSEEEIKTAYKTAVKKHHPDKFKDPKKKEAAEIKIKEINSAYEFLTKKQDVSSGFFSAGESSMFDFINAMNNNFGNFHSSQQGFSRQGKPEAKRHSPPIININITFEESILGTKKDIEYKKLHLCTSCSGAGVKFDDNNMCHYCGGQGQVQQTQNTNSNMFFTVVRTCDACNGAGFKSEKCDVCDGVGGDFKLCNITIGVPPGVKSGDTLRLARAGNQRFVNTFANAYDAFANILIEPNNMFVRVGDDVQSNVEISLIEALNGCHKKIKTVNGDFDLTIDKATKNKDIIKIPGMGVGGNNFHNVIVNVEYPKNIDKLVDILKDADLE